MTETNTAAQNNYSYEGETTGRRGFFKECSFLANEPMRSTA